MRLAVAGGVDGEAEHRVGGELVIHVEAEAGLVLGRREAGDGEGAGGRLVHAAESGPQTHNSQHHIVTVHP